MSLSLEEGVVTEATLNIIQARIGICASAPDIVPKTREELLRALEKKDSLPPDLQGRLECLAAEFGRAHPTAE